MYVTIHLEELSLYTTFLLQAGVLGESQSFHEDHQGNSSEQHFSMVLLRQIIRKRVKIPIALLGSRFLISNAKILSDNCSNCAVTCPKNVTERITAPAV